MKKPIVFFTNSMQVGGAERVASVLCNRWAESGVPVKLVITYSQGGPICYPLDDLVDIEFLSERVGTTRKTALTGVRRLLAMRRIVRQYGAGAVVSFLPQVNVATLLATLGLKVRVIVSERAYPPAMPLGTVWTFLRNHLYPCADAVVMQTRAGLEWLSAAIPGARGEVIPNPCIYPVESAEPVILPSEIHPQDRNLLLAAGRLEEQKGFTGLVRVFADIADDFPDWDLVILGEGSLRPVLEEEIERAGLFGRVFLPGVVGNPGDWYAHASVFVMSSEFEGFPNALLEAMAYGVPAVSFDCMTGPKDIIESETNGMLVPLDEGFEGLEYALRNLRAQPDVQRRLGSEATRVRERFAVSRVASQWLALAESAEEG